jgi:hypothetical protein
MRAMQIARTRASGAKRMLAKIQSARRHQFANHFHADEHFLQGLVGDRSSRTWDSAALTNLLAEWCPYI